MYDQMRSLVSVFYINTRASMWLIASALDILLNLKSLPIECRVAEELFEADKGGNKWEIIECCIQTQWDSKQMVAGFCKKEIHEYHCPLKSSLRGIFAQLVNSI